MRASIWSRSLILAVAVVLSLGGCSGLSYNSEISPEIQRGKYSTFAVVPIESQTLDPEVSRMLESMTVDEFVRKGYRKADPAQASAKVIIQARLEEFVDESEFGKKDQEQTGEYRIAKEGTIQIILYDAETEAWLWKSEAKGLAQEQSPGKSEKSKERIREIVAKMLLDIPARK